MCFCEDHSVVVQHEETGGIPLNLLQEQLEKYNLQKDLPPGGLAALLQRADQDKDGILDYEEFIHLVSEGWFTQVINCPFRKLTQYCGARIGVNIPRDRLGRPICGYDCVGGIRKGSNLTDSCGLY